MHVFTCNHPVAKQSREDALKTTLSTIQSAGTPPIILASIQSGLQQWTTNPDLPAYIIPVDILTKPQSASVVSAFNSQGALGWEAFLRGHITKQWTAAYQSHYRHKSKKPVLPATMSRLAKQWSSKVIQTMWIFCKSVWSAMRKSISTYQQYSQDPHYVNQSNSYLFKRPLESFCRLRRYTLTCWLQSVREAVLTKQHRIKLLHHSMGKFLRKRTPSSTQKQQQSSTALWHPPSPLHTTLNSSEQKDWLFVLPTLHG